MSLKRNKDEEVNFSNPFIILYNDVLIYLIVNFIYDEDKLAFRQTCKRMNQYVCNTIRSITIKFEIPSKIDVSFLSQFNNLSNLTIHAKKGKSKMNLYNFPINMNRIKMLNVVGIDISHEELIKFENVTSISFQNTSGSEIFSLNQLKHLKNITTTLPNFPLEDSKKLFPFQNLESLQFYRENFYEFSNFRYAFITILNKMNSVEKICLYDYSEIEYLSLSIRENITNFTIPDTLGNIPSYIHDFKSLKHLSCGGIDSTYLKFLPESLVSFHCGNIYRSYNDRLPKVDNFKNLKSFSIIDDNEHFFILDNILENMNQLEILKCNCGLIENANSLKHLHKLKTLELPLCSSTSSYLEEENSKWPNLTSLSITKVGFGLQLTIGSLQHISHFKNLVSLEIPEMINYNTVYQYLPCTLKKLTASRVHKKSLYDMKFVGIQLEDLSLYNVPSEKNIKWNIEDIYNCFGQSLQTLELKRKYTDQFSAKIFRKITINDLFRFPNLIRFYVYPKVMTLININELLESKKKEKRNTRFAIVKSIKYTKRQKKQND
jgi:hypothetical protein